MKRLLILAAAVAVTSGASWTPFEKALGVTSIALDVQDYKQTKAIIAQNGHEDNPITKGIIGEHPSDGKLFAYKFSGTAFKLWAADSLPKYRNEILIFANIFQLSINARNAKTIGWKWGF